MASCIEISCIHINAYLKAYSLWSAQISSERRCVIRFKITINNNKTVFIDRIQVDIAILPKSYPGIYRTYILKLPITFRGMEVHTPESYNTR